MAYGFLESGTSATFDLTHWSDLTTFGSATIASASDRIYSGPRSLKLTSDPSGNSAIVQASGSDAIGMDGTYTTTPHLWSLFGCGLLVAYTVPRRLEGGNVMGIQQGHRPI